MHNLPRERKPVPGLSKLAELEGRYPKVQCFCFYCGRPFMTREGAMLVPPDPYSVRSLDQLEPVTTCNSCECNTKEIQRQDSIAQLLIADTRERYYAERDARMAQRKG